jgi:hypothetical protein
VALLFHSQPDAEPVVISLVLDTSSQSWKRQNPAGALGEHGTEAARGPLQQIASQPAATDDLESLRLREHSSLDCLERRLQAAHSDPPLPGNRGWGILFEPPEKLGSVDRYCWNEPRGDFRLPIIANAPIEIPEK